MKAGQLFSACLIVVAVSGCSAMQKIPGSPARQQEKLLRMRTPLTPAVETGARLPDSLKDLEALILSSEAAEINVPTQTLRELLDSRRALEARYQDLDQRFNALKNVDLGRTTETQPAVEP